MFSLHIKLHLFAIQKHIVSKRHSLFCSTTFDQPFKLVSIASSSKNIHCRWIGWFSRKSKSSEKSEPSQPNETQTTESQKPKIEQNVPPSSHKTPNKPILQHTKIPGVKQIIAVASGKVDRFFAFKIF
jgi:hypothetical protein